MTEIRRQLDMATSSGEAVSKRVTLYGVMLAKGVRSRMHIEITHAELSPFWYLVLVTDFPDQSGETDGGDAIGT